jgi:hypothetical protein
LNTRLEEILPALTGYLGGHCRRGRARPAPEPYCPLRPWRRAVWHSYGTVWCNREALLRHRCCRPQSRTTCPARHTI